MLAFEFHAVGFAVMQGRGAAGDIHFTGGDIVPETLQGVEQGSLAGLGVNVRRTAPEIGGLHGVAHRFLLPPQGNFAWFSSDPPGCEPRMVTKISARRRYFLSPVVR